MPPGGHEHEVDQRGCKGHAQDGGRRTKVGMGHTVRVVSAFLPDGERPVCRICAEQTYDGQFDDEVCGKTRPGQSEQDYVLKTQRDVESQTLVFQGIQYVPCTGYVRQQGAYDGKQEQCGTEFYDRVEYAPFPLFRRRSVKGPAAFPAERGAPVFPHLAHGAPITQEPSAFPAIRGPLSAPLLTFVAFRRRHPCPSG